MTNDRDWDRGDDETPSDHLAEFIREIENGKTIDVDQYCHDRGDEDGHLRREIQFFLEIARDLGPPDGEEMEGIPPSDVECADTVVAPESPNPSIPNLAEIEGFRLDDTAGRQILGSGGMGTVFLAFQESLQRHVALKTVPSTLTSRRGDFEALRHEADLLSRIRHPNVLTCFGLRKTDKIWFLILEYAPNGTLRDTLEKLDSMEIPKRQPHHLPNVEPSSRSYEEACAQLILHVLDGLHALHQKGLVHRDLKPANLLLGSDGNLKIADLGLAKELLAASGFTTTLTGGGTPEYMSPEQVHGRFGLDHRSDLFSIGIVFFELLTGRRPFGNRPSSNRSILLGRHPKPSSFNRKVSKNLENILDRALEKEPDHRYSSADEFANDIRHWLRREPIQAGSPSLGDRSRRLWLRHNRTARSGILSIGVGTLGFLFVLLLSSLLAMSPIERVLDFLGGPLAILALTLAAIGMGGVAVAAASAVFKGSRVLSALACLPFFSLAIATVLGVFDSPPAFPRSKALAAYVQNDPQWFEDQWIPPGKEERSFLEFPYWYARRKGHADQRYSEAISYLESLPPNLDGIDSPAFRILRASLLLRSGSAPEASESLLPSDLSMEGAPASLPHLLGRWARNIEIAAQISQRKFEHALSYWTPRFGPTGILPRLANPIEVRLKTPVWKDLDTLLRDSPETIESRDDVDDLPLASPLFWQYWKTADLKIEDLGHGLPGDEGILYSRELPFPELVAFGTGLHLARDPRASDFLREALYDRDWNQRGDPHEFLALLIPYFTEFVAVRDSKETETMFRIAISLAQTENQVTRLFSIPYSAARAEKNERRARDIAAALAPSRQRLLRRFRLCKTIVDRSQVK